MYTTHIKVQHSTVYVFGEVDVVIAHRSVVVFDLQTNRICLRYQKPLVHLFHHQQCKTELDLEPRKNIEGDIVTVYL